ncbi:MAG TPA: hypothetical protein VF063_04015 [Gaiellaceae bacterium]
MTAAGLRLLRDARTLVAEAWCNGAEARDSAGSMVSPWDDRAASWSLLGAIVAVLEREASFDRELSIPELATALYALAKLVDCDSLIEWNDRPRQTQGNVVAVLDRAAADYEETDTFFASLN